jgi:hypothetical protein
MRKHTQKRMSTSFKAFVLYKDEKYQIKVVENLTRTKSHNFRKWKNAVNKLKYIKQEKLNFAEKQRYRLFLKLNYGIV